MAKQVELYRFFDQRVIKDDMTTQWDSFKSKSQPWSTMKLHTSSSWLDLTPTKWKSPACRVARLFDFIYLDIIPWPVSFITDVFRKLWWRKRLIFFVSVHQLPTLQS